MRLWPEIKSNYRCNRKRRLPFGLFMFDLITPPHSNLKSFFLLRQSLALFVDSVCTALKFKHNLSATWSDLTFPAMRQRSHAQH